MLSMDVTLKADRRRSADRRIRSGVGRELEWKSREVEWRERGLDPPGVVDGSRSAISQRTLLRARRPAPRSCSGLRRSMAETKAVSRPPHSKRLARGAGAKWFARSSVRDRRPGDEPSAQGTVRTTLGEQRRRRVLDCGSLLPLWMGPACWPLGGLACGPVVTEP